MAEMRPQEAIDLLIQPTVPLSTDQRVDIAAVILRLYAENYITRTTIERINKLLPDEYSESKDWKAGDSVERIEWLKGMYGSKCVEIIQLEDEIARRDTLSEASK